MTVSQNLLSIIEAVMSDKPNYEYHPYDAPIQKQYPKHATVWGLLKATQDYREGKNIQTAKGGTVKVFSIEFTPFFGMNTLQIVSQAMGSEKTSKRHVQVIRFLDMKFANEPTQGYIPAIDSKTSEKFYFKPIQSKVNRVDIWCDCLDFAFRSSYWVDSRFHALATQVANAIKNYKRKTPPPKPDGTGGMPYANPQHLPVFCKHLYEVMGVLSNKGIIV